MILIDGSTITNRQNIVLADANGREIGEIKPRQPEQSYVLPPDVDLDRFNTVAIYSASLHAVFATAKLDAF